jgi:glycosyltransferase involved in cell wall biosynthesis
MLISVLMSIYNESENEIKESIESILQQTFTSFEFIIVNDNPQREDLVLLLNYYNNIDPRIVILKNEQNIGLALSLNKAAALPEPIYLQEWMLMILVSRIDLRYSMR